MDSTRCAICGWYNVDKLCKKHKRFYMWDSSIQAYRLKKRSNGCRYTTLKFHKSETELVRILEEYFGKNDIFTSVHPIWAESEKGVLYEYDIYIKSIRLFIEYDGQQHYKFVKIFHKTKKNFTRQQYRDSQKNKLAAKNNFKLIHIRFDEPLYKDYILQKLFSTGAL